MTNVPLTIKEALEGGAERLRSHGLDSPTVVVELLLLHVLQCKRVDLYLNLNQVLNQSQSSQFDSLLSQRIAGKPVQYLAHSANFFGFELYVDENVLIPRPETEILVETVLQRLSQSGNKLKIIDWGTGSGNIAIALAAHLNCEICAVDISEKTLKIAEKNILTHGLGQKIRLLQGNGFSALPKNSKKKIDAVVSNPPYVRISEMSSLPREVRDYEPREALFDRGEGLYFTSEIISGAKEFLKKEGLLAVEVALDGAKSVTELISQTKAYHKIEIVPDLAGIERVVIAAKR